MNKLIIKKINITNTSRDISSFNSELSDELNLICGNNETGKSSLLEFIREGFWGYYGTKNKTTEQGKIFFSYAGKDLKADINNSQKSKNRLKIFDINDNCIDFSFDRDVIERYKFNNIYTFDLSDLTQNKTDDELLNTINDMATKNLNKYYSELNSKINNILTLKGNTLKGDYKNVLNEIKKLNDEINLKSNKESEYNEIISNIEEKEKLKERYENEYIFLTTAQRYNNLEKEIQVLQQDFNKKLYNNKKELSEINIAASEYISNIKMLKKQELKLEDIICNINNQYNKIKNLYNVELTEDKINKLDINYEDIEKIRKLNNELTVKKGIYSNLEKNVSHENEQINITEAESDILILKTNIETFKITQSKYIELSEKYENNKTIKRHNIFYIIFFVLTFIFGLFELKNDITTSAILFLISALSVIEIAHAFKTKNTANSNQILQNKNDNEYAKKNLEEILSKYPNYKAENITELLIKSQDLKENLEKKINQRKQHDELNKIKKEIDENESLIKSIAQYNLDILNINSTENYENIVIDTDNLKNAIKEKENLEDEINKNKVQNKIKFNTIINFISENNLNIFIREDFSENLFEKILDINTKNDAIFYKIDNLKKIQSEEKKKSEKLSTDIDLSDLNEQGTEEKISQLKLQTDIIKKELEELKAHKLNLEDYENIENLKIQKNIKQEEYNNIIKELFSNKIALEIIDKSKEEYYQEQPNLKKAGEYLSLLTDEKYNQINIENKTISGNNSVSKSWDTLSRGTKEQLYIALRLGYIINYDKISAPIIIDDAFVNFDRKRTKNIIKCLKEISKTNQIIFLTCHQESMKEIFNEINSKYNYIEIN